MRLILFMFKIFSISNPFAWLMGVGLVKESGFKCNQRQSLNSFQNVLWRRDFWEFSHNREKLDFIIQYEAFITSNWGDWVFNYHRIWDFNCTITFLAVPSLHYLMSIVCIILGVALSGFYGPAFMEEIYKYWDWNNRYPLKMQLVLRLHLGPWFLYSSFWISFTCINTSVTEQDKFHFVRFPCTSSLCLSLFLLFHSPLYYLMMSED